MSAYCSSSDMAFHSDSVTPTLLKNHSLRAFLVWLPFAVRMERM